MKKIIKAITLFLIIAIFSEVSYAAEYLNSVEFNEKYMNNNVMWSGKEWITDSYPPKISQDGTDFTEIEGNKEIPNIMKFGHCKYVWTGSEYLVYQKNHSYLDVNHTKYMYRLSEDFNTILNTYQIPNLINNLEFIDDKIFIATENVLPNYKEFGNPHSGVWSQTKTAYEIYYSGKRVLIIEIDKARLYPIEFDNVAYIRVGQQKRKLCDYKEKEKKLWNMLNKTSFEEEIALSKLEIEDVIDLLEISTYYKMLELPYPETKEKIIEDFMEEGFIKEIYGKLAITNLGAILFAKNVHQFKSISRKSIRLIQYKDKNKLETIREVNYDSGYAICFEEILKNLDLLTPQNEHIGLALRKQVKMYPEIALRELIANAMIHQDFTIGGTSILIELFSNRIEISNPGTPLISIDRFIDHNPISRNEKLASIMRRFKICEEKGSGIDKVIKSVELYQLPAPNFLEYDNGTKVILYSYKQLSEMDRDDKLRACYQHACLQYVSGEKMTNESLRTRFNIEKKNAAIASRILSDAVLSELIKEYQPNSESRRYKSYLQYSTRVLI